MWLLAPVMVCASTHNSRPIHAEWIVDVFLAVKRVATGNQMDQVAWLVIRERRPRRPRRPRRRDGVRDVFGLNRASRWQNRGRAVEVARLQIEAAEADKGAVDASAALGLGLVERVHERYLSRIEVYQAAVTESSRRLDGGHNARHGGVFAQLANQYVYGFCAEVDTNYC